MEARTTHLQQRFEAVEREIERLHDQLSIYQLISSLGPAVDSGSSRYASELWTEDGTYDVPTFGSWIGHDAIAGMLNGSAHQELIHSGAAHIIGMPHIWIGSEFAVATCYARVYRPEANPADGFRVWRVTANRLEFVRTPHGWRIRKRVQHLVDGGDQARELLREGIQASDAFEGEARASSRAPGRTLTGRPTDDITPS